jgi:hypothetical protein
LKIFEISNRISNPEPENASYPVPHKNETRRRISGDGFGSGVLPQILHGVQKRPQFCLFRPEKEAVNLLVGL